VIDSEATSKKPPPAVKEKPRNSSRKEVADGKKSPILPRKEVAEGKKSPILPRKEVADGKKSPIPPPKEVADGKKSPIPPQKEVADGKKSPIPPQKEVADGKKSPITPQKEVADGKKSPILPPSQIASLASVFQKEAPVKPSKVSATMFSAILFMSSQGEDGDVKDTPVPKSSKPLPSNGSPVTPKSSPSPAPKPRPKPTMRKKAEPADEKPTQVTTG
jgi:hypothetical protein